MNNLTLNINKPVLDRLNGSADKVIQCYSRYALNDSSKHIVRCLNDAKAEDYIPAILYLAILMVVGTSGNLMVGYLYYFRLKKDSYRLFILCLAVMDLTNCLVGMPAELVDLCYPLMLYSPGGCKALRFIESVVVVSSAVILIQVAIARYYKTCKPLKKLRLHKTRILCGSAFVCGFCLSWPAILIFGKKTIDLPLGLKGQDCSTADSMEGSVFIVLYYVLLICAFVISVFMLSVIYIIIGIKLWHKRRMTIVEKRTDEPVDTESFRPVNRIRHSPRRNLSSSSSADSMPEPRSPNSVTGLITKVHTFPKKYSTTSSFSFSSYSKSEMGRHNSSDAILSIRRARPTIKTGKMTVIMCSITITFILTFLPYLIMMICRSVDKQWAHFESVASEVAYKIASKSFFLNSALNPIIYSFLSERFRKECVLTVRDVHKACLRIRIGASATDASGNQKTRPSAYP